MTTKKSSTKRPLASPKSDLTPTVQSVSGEIPVAKSDSKEQNEIKVPVVSGVTKISNVVKKSGNKESKQKKNKKDLKNAKKKQKKIKKALKKAKSRKAGKKKIKKMKSLFAKASKKVRKIKKDRS